MRLNQKHSKYVYEERRDLDPEEIVAAQSLPSAVVAAAAVIVLVTLAAIALAAIFGRVFPWIVLVQGALIGIAIRRYGAGFDWRFALLGGLAGLAGAYLSNFILAADAAGDELGISTMRVILNMSEYTLATYFAEDVSPADHIFAFFAAAFGAFFARRQLSRDEYRAIRLMKQAKTSEVNH